MRLNIFGTRLIRVIVLILFAVACACRVSLSWSLRAKSCATNAETICLKAILTDELPLSRRSINLHGRDELLEVAFAHHWDAGRVDMWNEEIRLLPEPTIVAHGCSIWEVGANIAASDSRRLMQIFPTCTFHAYEPVPQFAKELVKKWQARESRRPLHVHTYGLGLQSRNFTMDGTQLAGESTYIEEAPSGDVKIEVKSFFEAAKDAGGIPSLVSINCEGCEWRMISEGLEAGFFQKVKVIQISWHNYGGTLGLRVRQLCELRQRLSNTHDMVKGVAFGWERWKMKGLT